MNSAIEQKQYELGKVPTISVVMSVYNDAAYLNESIDSILNQTFSDFEFIIFDDASNDDSPNILYKYAEQDKRIKLIINTENQGLTKNLNAAINLSTGKYIARMDGDDISLLSRFQKQIEFLSADPELVMTGSWTYNISSSGDLISTSQYPTEAKVFSWSSIFRPTVAHPSVMLKAEVIRNNKIFYNEKLRTAQDFELWSRLREFGNISVQPEFLLKYRSHDNNVSNQRKSEQSKLGAATCFKNIINMFKGEQILDENKTHYLTSIMFGNEKHSFRTTYTSIKYLIGLMNCFIKKNNCSRSTSLEIRKLTSRWIIQTIFTKNKISILRKLGLLILLAPLLDALFFELVDYRDRRNLNQQNFINNENPNNE